MKGLPDPCDFGLDVINDDNTAYLLPDDEDDHQRDRILRRYARLIFEDQLAAWWLDERDGPVKREVRAFKKWFVVEIHSMVHDFVEGPIREV